MGEFRGPGSGREYVAELPWEPGLSQSFQARLTAPHKKAFSSVQLLSHVRLFATPWNAARQASLSITYSWSLPKFMSIE